MGENIAAGLIGIPARSVCARPKSASVDAKGFDHDHDLKPMLHGRGRRGSADPIVLCAIAWHKAIGARWVILSFKDTATERAFNGIARKGFPADLLQVCRRKLRMLHRATALNDLRFPLGNGLEALSRERTGQHAIRVNDQYRICFVWRGGHAYDVEFTDYH